MPEISGPTQRAVGGAVHPETYVPLNEVTGWSGGLGGGGSVSGAGLRTSSGVILDGQGNPVQWKETETVDHPSHYTSHPSGVEAITITEGFNFNIGNAIKYCWRAGLKSPDPIEDLKKAAWYVNREISRREKKCSST